MGKAQTNASKRYNLKAYDRIEITVPKGEKEKISEIAESVGMSVNAFIKEAVSDYIAQIAKA